MISQITDSELAWKPVSYLSRLSEESKKIEGEVVHRARLSVVGFKWPSGSASSNSIKECIRVCDNKTGKSRAADAKALKKGESLVFALPLFVKDFSTLHSNRTAVVHLIDSNGDGKSGFFPGISVEQLLKSDGARQKALEALKLLLKFNVHLEVALSVSSDGYMIIQSDKT